VSEFYCRVLEREDAEKFKELHNILFKNTAMSHEWWDWYREIERFDRSFFTRVYGAFEGDRLIGIWCVEPKNMLANGETLRVGRCFSVGIHPDYQRRGLFVKLSVYAIEKEREKGQYEYILGFPQVGRSVIEGHIKSGWHRVQVIQMRSIKTVGVLPSVSLGEVRRIDDFSRLLSSTQIDGDFITSHSYRNRKWINHPDNSYICLSKRSAFVVAKVYKDFCHILDIGGDNENISPLIEAIKTLSVRHRWREITVWCASNDPRLDVIETAGFTEGSDCGTSVELLAVRINAKIDLSLDSCCFQMGVEEIY
jgi:GNAT superfamily N-acetyltransferase